MTCLPSRAAAAAAAMLMLPALVAATGAAARSVRIEGPAAVPQVWRATGEEVPAGAELPLFIGLKRDFSAVARAFREVSDPAHPNYGQHLSHEEVEAAVRAPAVDIERVRSWIHEAGAKGIVVHRHGDSIKAKVSAAAAERISGSPLRVFRHAKSDAMAVVATEGVTVPAEIADLIDYLGGFTSFPLIRRASKVRTDSGAGGSPKGVTPPLIRKTYGVTGGATNSSGTKNIQAIAQFQGSFYIESDVEALCKRYDLGSCDVAKLVGDNSGGANPFESNLDVEYTTSAVADTDIETWVYGYKGAHLTDFCGTFVQLLSDVVSGDEHPWVVSVSYGSQKRGICNSASVQRAEQDAQKLGAMGVTLLIASGDDGSGQFTRQGDNGGWLAPSWPSSMQSALAVGSTFFQKGLSGPEEATRRFGSGGGFSTDYTVPAYQKQAVSDYLQQTTLPEGVKFCVPGHGGFFTKCSTMGRATPDVAFLGDGYDTICEGLNFTVGGTSASTPSWAAIISRLNEERLASGGKTLGFINPLLYSNPSVLNDITVGTNAVQDSSHHGGKVGWNCTKGWDAVTGLGTPNFPKLLELVRKTAK